jgi:hypothetical protein
MRPSPTFSLAVLRTTRRLAWLGGIVLLAAQTKAAVLSWESFLGGMSNDCARTAVADRGGNCYVAGYSAASWGFIAKASNTLESLAPPSSGNTNGAFIAKLDSSGKLSWSAFLGSANGGDQINGIALDSSNNVYVIGQSSEKWGSPVRAYSNGIDVFVAKVSSSGTLIWNTFLGGSGDDCGYGIALDSDNTVLVTGNSSASWGASPVRDYTDDTDCFAAKLSNSGSLIWNSFLGDKGPDGGSGIAVDPKGNAYVSGCSSTAWGSPIRAYSNKVDAFVVKLDHTGSLAWTTFLGGDGNDSAQAIALDSSGNIYAGGYAGATWGSPLKAFAGGTEDGFVAKLDSNGSLYWNTFIGGSGLDEIRGIAVDSVNNIYLAGYSDATWGSPWRPYTSGVDAFAAQLSSGGSAAWNTFLGGSVNDYGYGLALDTGTNVFIAGSSAASWGAPVRSYAGGNDGFLAKITLVAAAPVPFSKLQILLPGETAAPGTMYGKTGLPIAQTSGIPFNVTVNAVDGSWNLVNTNDIIAITSSDVNALLPTNAALSSGTHTFSVTLKTAGTYTITARDVTQIMIPSCISTGITVNAGAFIKLQVLMPGETSSPGSLTGKTGTPTAQTVGIPFNFTVRAVDMNWNQVRTNSTASISSSDDNASLPPNGALSQTFTLTFRTAGTQTVTASNVPAPSILPNTGTATTVNKGTQIITFPAIANQVVTNRVVLSATSSCGLLVTFAVASGPGIITNGTNLTFSGGGTVSITASQGGNSNWNRATNVNRSFFVNCFPVPASPAIQRWPFAGVKVRLENLLGTDPDGDAISVISVESPNAEGATIRTDTTWAFYTPVPGFTNTDAFSYWISDTHGGTSSGTVTVQSTINTVPSQNYTIETLSDDSVQLHVFGIPGRTYMVYYTDTLAPENWQQLITRTADESGEFSFHDTPPGDPRSRYYRALDITP